METRTTADHDRMAFGEFLRQARERRRLTLEQISDETKIAPRLLTSLEQGNLQSMPKGMYRRAMLRAYAESVGLDTEAALTEFERTFEEPPPREAPLPPVPTPATTAHVGAAPEPRRRLRPAVVAIAGVVVATVVGLGAWAWSDGRASGPRVIAIAPPANSPDATTPDPAPPTSPAAAQTPTVASPTPAVPPAAAATREPRASARPPAREVPRTTMAAQKAVRPAAVGTSGAASAAPLATEGQLMVVSEPAGARVTVNGVGWGSTPLTIRYLPLGEKRVRVTKEGYLSEERTVRVDGRRPAATIRLTLKERR